jgi:hypothetical protein
LGLSVKFSFGLTTAGALGGLRNSNGEDSIRP